MATLTKFELSYAYPFMSLSFVAVFFLSIFLYSEPLTWQKAGGLSLIILGLIVLTQK
jgi:multidrug transporter EmrE-like cation transporter